MTERVQRIVAVGIFKPPIVLPQPLGAAVDRIGVTRVPETMRHRHALLPFRRVEHPQDRVRHDRGQVAAIHRQRGIVRHGQPQIPRGHSAGTSGGELGACRLQERHRVEPIARQQRVKLGDGRVDIAGLAFNPTPRQQDIGGATRRRMTEPAQGQQRRRQVRRCSLPQGIVSQFHHTQREAGIDCRALDIVPRQRREEIATERGEDAAYCWRIGIGFGQFGPGQTVPRQRPLGLQLSCPAELAFGIAEVGRCPGQLGQAQIDKPDLQVAHRIVAVPPGAVDLTLFETEQRGGVGAAGQRVAERPQHGARGRDLGVQRTGQAQQGRHSNRPTPAPAGLHLSAPPGIPVVGTSFRRPVQSQ
jgi:hypothetical protein